MPDIFVSYAHEDRDRVRPLVEHLETEGWTVWWDRSILPGTPWEPSVYEEMARSRAVLVVWSVWSVGSDWVSKEAAIGLEKNALVAVTIDAYDPLPDFAEYQATNLQRWRSGSASHEMQALTSRTSHRSATDSTEASGSIWRRPSWVPRAASGGSRDSPDRACPTTTRDTEARYTSTMAWLRTRRSLCLQHSRRFSSAAGRAGTTPSPRT